MNENTKIAWAAGLFEGEGCVYKTANSSGSFYICLSLCSTDLDVVTRFFKIVGSGRMYGPYQPRYLNAKLKYDWRSTRRDDTEKILNLLIPYLGERRLDRIRELNDLVTKPLNLLL